MSRILITALALCLAAPALAERPSYNYVQFAYETVDLDVGGGSDVDGDGFAIGGAFEINDEFFITAGYAKADFDFNVDFTTLQAGLGWRTDLTDTTDFFSTLSYVNGEVDAPGFGSFDDSGFGISIGLRSNINDNVELFGAINHVDFGDGGDSTGISGGFWYNFNESVSAGLGLSSDDDITSWGAAVRFYFDR